MLLPAEVDALHRAPDIGNKRLASAPGFGPTN